MAGNVSFEGCHQMTDIRQWLDDLGLAQYADAFEANHIDASVLPLLSDHVLKDVGVISAGHRLRILAAVKRLSPSTPPESAVPEPPASDGERRQATVLFADLSGYTALNERLDPETVADVTSRIKAEAVRVVEAHGGIVNQFVGDEILALFGIPAAHEDDPVRAVRAALALHRLVHEMAAPLEARLGHPLRLHSGIATGLIVTNSRDARDGTYGITGDTVNTGARLAAHAPPDTVLVSPHTHRRIADFFETRPLPLITLKGKAEPLIPHQILGPTQTETRFEAAQRRGLTAYVGRTDELATLLACMARAQAGHGHFVAVTGEAGAGKSRLLFELRNSLDPDTVRIVQGRCQSYGTDTPFLPFLDALRRALDFREDDAAEQLLEKTLTAVRALDPALERFLPHYLHLLSIPSEQHPLPATLQGAERRRALEEALAAIFTLAARARPLLLVLEDWHWVDPTSDAVLKRLVGLVDQYPLLLVVLFRPEYDLAWAAPARLTRLVLRPLSAAETSAMARTALNAADLPEAVHALVHERTGGNPLFIEEVCLTLLEEQILSVQEGRATLTRRLDAVQLPHTVQAVIRARVDRLDQATQEVLRLASVIGREFARTLLERIVAAKDALDSTLDTLNTQDLIRQVRVLPEPEYMFKHVLTQVVVYETLLLLRRQALHALIGRAIEEVYADRLEEHYEALAYHYQRSDDPEKAIQYLERAGDKAKAQYVLQQTLKNYQQAIALLAELDPNPERMRQHIDISVKWGDLIVPSAEIIHTLQRAQAFAEQLQDSERLAQAASFLGQMLFYVCNYDPAIAALRRVIDMADLLENQDRVGSSHRVLGQLYLYTGRQSLGLESVKRALPIVRRTKNRFEESCSIGLIATEYGLRGRFAESYALFEDALRIAREGRERSIEVWNLVFRGWVQRAEGDWPALLAASDQAAELAERIENLWVGLWATINRGSARFRVGDEDGGLALVRQVARAFEEAGGGSGIASVYTWLSELLYDVGQIEESLTYADKAIDTRHLSSFGFSPFRMRAMAASQLSPVDWASVESDMQSSFAYATSVGYRPELAMNHFRYAEILRTKGDLARARPHLDDAIKLFTELDMPWWLEQAAKLSGQL